MTDSPEPIERWGSAPAPRASLVAPPDSRYWIVGMKPADWLDGERDSQHPPNRPLQSLITATGSHVTLGTPCVAPEEIPVTDEMLAAVPCRFWRSNAPTPRDIAELYRAMAAIAPKDNADPGDCLRIELGALKAETDYERRELRTRIAALEAENAQLRQSGALVIHATDEAVKSKDARIATLEAENAALEGEIAAFGLVTPVDLPDPPRRADGTLAPVAKPWTPPKAAGDTRRVGS